MAKRKPTKKNEQPELPLDATPAAEPQTPNAKGQTPNEKDPASAAPAIENPESKIENQEPQAPKRPKGQKVQDEQAPLAQAYRNWFLDYASYVILDRAVPHIDDGLKPVQRRVLHTLWDMDDGRFHKVANVVGAAMKLHPHGDASIGAALVGIAQRGWLIEPQGNF
ncbi:MAG TPA: DNA gyrase subunit A, partial [Lacunisphaera sp.]